MQLLPINLQGHDDANTEGYNSVGARSLKSAPTFKSMQSVATATCTQKSYSYRFFSIFNFASHNTFKDRHILFRNLHLSASPNCIDMKSISKYCCGSLIEHNLYSECDSTVYACSQSVPYNGVWSSISGFAIIGPQLPSYHQCS